MRSLASLVTISLTAATALAAPLVSLTPDDIEKAGGGIPNVSPPPGLKVTELAVASYQSANFLENLQYAFFTAVLANLTSDKSYGKGYKGPWKVKDKKGLSIVEAVEKIRAQGKVHLVVVEFILTSWNASVIPACQYTFPVSSMK